MSNEEESLVKIVACFTGNGNGNLKTAMLSETANGTEGIVLIQSPNAEAQTWPYSCNERLLQSLSYMFMTLSVFSSFLLIALSRRVNYKDPRRNCCWGHPGYPVPLNMLDGYEHRFAYCAAMTYDLYNILRKSFDLIPLEINSIGPISLNVDVEQWRTMIVILLRLVLTLFFTILYYPFFLCLSTDFKFIGALLGICLSSTRLCEWIYQTTCIGFDPRVIPHLCISDSVYACTIRLSPVIVYMLLFFFVYVLNIIWSFRYASFLKVKRQKIIAYPHHIEHVKYLLGKEPLPWSESNYPDVSSLQRFRIKYGFRKIPGCKFPTRVLATFTVTVFLLYQILFDVANSAIRLLEYLETTAECVVLSLPDGMLPSCLAAETIVKYIRVTKVIWVVMLGVNALLAVIYIYLMCLAYRRQTLRIYRGDRTLFPSGWDRRKKTFIVIAYTLWGFVIIQFFTFLILVTFTYVIFMPLYECGERDILYQTLIAAGGVLLTNQFIIWIQMLLMKMFFLQPKVKSSDQQAPLAINNVRAWYSPSFFFFFWKLFLGAVAALMRVLRGMVFGVFLLPRIDRPVVMKGFEMLEIGFTAFLSLLTVINSHDHPVVKVFIKVLPDGAKATRENRSYSYRHISEMLELHLIRPRETGNTAEARKRAMYHWCLAYTFINNPEVIKYRKVEVDEVDQANGKKYMVKHKICVAAHRKRKGEKFVDMLGLE